MQFIPIQKDEKNGLGNLWDFGSFNIGFNPVDNSLLDTPNYVDKSVINAANDPNNYFNSAEFKAGISADFMNGGDTSGPGILNFDKIYASEKAKYEQEGYKNTQQQQNSKAGKSLLDNHLERTKIEENYKNGITNSITTSTNNQSNGLDNTPSKQWIKGFTNLQSGLIGFGLLAGTATVIIVVATPGKKGKRQY